MRKNILFLAVSCLLAVGMARQPNQASAEKQKSSDPPNPAPVAINNQNETNYYASKPNENPPKWYAPIERPDWWLVLVAALTGFVIWRQTQATRKAAEAALQSAQAAVNADRAWIFPELVPMYIKSGDLWFQDASNHRTQLTMMQIMTGEHLKHKLKITNMGRTPARVLSFQISYSKLLEGVKVLPENSEGDFVEKREWDRLIAAGAEIEILDPLIEVHQFMRDSIKEVGDSKRIEDSIWTLVFHGYVEYLHVFSDKAEVATFCYSYSPTMKGLSRVRRPKF